jgi:hypothetical protein
MLGVRSAFGIAVVLLAACGGNAVTEPGHDSTPRGDAGALNAGGGASGAQAVAVSAGTGAAGELGSGGAVVDGADIDDQTAMLDCQRLCAGLQHICRAAADTPSCVGACVNELITRPAVCWALARADNECFSMHLPSNAQPISCDDAMLYAETACPATGQALTKCMMHAYQDGWDPCEAVGHSDGGSCTISRKCAKSDWTLTCEPSAGGASTCSCAGYNGTKALGSFPAQGSRACSLASEICDL